ANTAGAGPNCAGDAASTITRACSLAGQGPRLSVPGHFLLRRVEHHAVQALAVDVEERPSVEREGRDVLHHVLELGVVQHLVALRLVDGDVRGLEDRGGLPVAVGNVVLAATAAVGVELVDVRRGTSNERVHRDIEVTRWKRRPEERARGLETRLELDADALQLLLDDLERERPECVAGRRRERERELADARAREDLVVARARRVRAAGAAVALQDLDHLLLAELDRSPVRLVLGDDRLEDEALQRLHGLLAPAVERLCDLW